MNKIYRHIKHNITVEEIKNNKDGTSICLWNGKKIKINKGLLKQIQTNK